jgi:hypothetical protein
MMTFAIENNTKNNLLEGTKQQRTRIITKRNLKKSCEDNRQALRQV